MKDLGEADVILGVKLTKIKHGFIMSIPLYRENVEKVQLF